MKVLSVLVDCVYAALGNGGIVKDLGRINWVIAASLAFLIENLFTTN